MSPDVSARRRQDIIDALRRGAVPVNGLDVLAVGLDRFVRSVDDDLDRVAKGGSVFKAVRGEYGAGKTFFTRWLAERAKRLGFATAEVQVSENRNAAAPHGANSRRRLSSSTTSLVERGFPTIRYRTTSLAAALVRPDRNPVRDHDEALTRRPVTPTDDNRSRWAKPWRKLRLRWADQLAGVGDP
jgi:P-loop Domain of unknown function (DUF2791)